MSIIHESLPWPKLTPRKAGQPYGERAKQALSDLAFGKPARVVVETTDKYGRTVGWVYVGGTDVNAEMVKQGAAWVYRKGAVHLRAVTPTSCVFTLAGVQPVVVACPQTASTALRWTAPYRKYAQDQSLYRLEEQAKAARRGLWGLPEAEQCPPWDWRRGTCNVALVSSAPAAATVNSGGFTCGGKRYCREMTSCEEAKFYLTQCGVRSLDGNHDGVPCAKLWPVAVARFTEPREQEVLLG